MSDVESTGTHVLRTPFMESTTLEEMNLMSERARGLIMAIRSFGNSTGNQLRAEIKDALPPDIILHFDISPWPIIWSELRKFLAQRHVNLIVHERRRAIFTIANSIFTYPEDKARALELANIILYGPPPSENTVVPERDPRPQSVGGKIAHNMAMRLKDHDQKFSGDLSQCLQDYIDEYEQVAEDYGLNNEQKLTYLHNMFSKEAHKFYLNVVKPNVHSYREAISELEKEYNSLVRQNRVKIHLSSLRLIDFISHNVNENNALSIVYKRIMSLSRQVPESHRGDAHRVEFLRSAVIGRAWATEPLSRIATSGLSFQELYSELEIAVQLHKETQAAAARDKPNIQQTNPHNIHFNGQGRSHGNKFGKSKYNYGHTGKKRNCFNCNSEEHLVRNCPHPVNYTKAAANRLKSMKKYNRPNAVHVVLAHLCSELDSQNNDSDDDPPTEEGKEDSDIFQSMIFNEVPSDASNEDGDDDVSEILAINLTFEHDNNRFWGGCLDSGAQKTVIGRPQAETYLRHIGADCGIESNKGSKVFRFGDNNHRCLGTLEVRLPIGPNFYIPITAHVVPIDVPLLIGIDVMKRLGMIINFSDNTLTIRDNNNDVSLEMKNGHLYLEWPSSTFYTETELKRIHRHFYHPSTEKLYSLMKRADIENVDADVKTTLEKIQKTCDTCQRHGSMPHRFRVAIPNDTCIFNRTVGMDLMKIGHRTAIHIVDRDTKFAAAAFLQGETTKHVWEAFLTKWVATYVGFPDEVTLDQGTQFQSAEFAALLNAAGIKRRDAGIESHNALGETERYHAYLRNIFTKIRTDHSSLSDDILLQLAIKACNDTAGPSGLVPTLLVFGAMPRLPVHPRALPEQRKRMIALHEGRNEMAKIIARTRVRTAANKQVPKAANDDVEIGDDVLIYRDPPINKWTGPHKVIDIDKKAVTVIYDGKLTLYSVDKCKRYETAITATETTLKDVCDDAVVLEQNTNNNQLDFGYWDFNDVQDDIFVVRLLKPNEARAKEKDFDVARRKEVDGLMRKIIWQVVNKNDIPESANVVGGRFMLTLKNVGTPDEAAKVRYIAQGYADSEKPFLVHDVSSLRPASIRFILSIASIKGMRLFLHDVSQAYLQSAEPLSRKIYLKPKSEDYKWFGINDGQALELKKPLYGLCDSGDYWNTTIQKHITNDLGMTPCISDTSLYAKFNNDDTLIGLTGNYVDDGVNAGFEEFETLTESTMKTFECKSREYDDFNFFGTRIKTIDKDMFMLNQEHYCNTLKELDKDADIEKLRSVRALLAWTVHTHPEVACIANKMAQVTANTLNKDRISELNRGIKKVKHNSKKGLTYKPLDQDTLHMRIYADASFATNSDESSQIGYLILLCDNDNRCHILDYASKKSRRVVRSIMGGELYAFTDDFDVGFTMLEDVRKLLKQKVIQTPVKCLTS